MKQTKTEKKKITEKVFRYPFLAQIIYKHAFYPLILLFGLQLGYSLYLVGASWANLIPATISLIILIVIFKYYSNISKNIPFKIELKENKLTCSEFGYSKKEVILPLDEISGVEGGIFSGKATRPVYIFSEKNDVMIGVLPHLKDYNNFISLILQSVDKEMFKNLVQGINDKANEMMSKRRKKKADKNASPKNK